MIQPPWRRYSAISTSGAIQTPARCRWMMLTRRTAFSSMSPIRCSTLRDSQVCSSMMGMATARPSSVVIRASLMPPDMSRGSPVPNRVITRKVSIMPVTVPSRPSSGATAPSTASMAMPC